MVTYRPLLLRRFTPPPAITALYDLAFTCAIRGARLITMPPAVPPIDVPAAGGPATARYALPSGGTERVVTVVQRHLPPLRTYRPAFAVAFVPFLLIC